jgi:hypothetical protein
MPNVNPNGHSQEQALLERRHATRVDAKLKVRFQELKPEEGDTAVFAMESRNLKFLEAQSKPSLNDPSQGQTLDISVGGIRLGGDMQLKVNRTLASGVFLRLEIYHPLNNFIIHAIAMVIWSHLSDSGKFEAGLSFFAIDESDVQKLRSYVDNNRPA